MRAVRMPFAREQIAGRVVLLVFLASPGASQTLNLSQDLVPLGIASTNMVPNQPSQDAGPLLTNGVAYAKTHGIPTVVADPGTYYFLSLQDNTHVALNGIDNMTIDLHGADLVFTHPLYYGIIVYYSTNAVLQNLTADYQPLPFTQVRVVAVDAQGSQIAYVPEPGWQDPVAFNSVPSPAPYLVELHIFRGGQPAFDTRRIPVQLPIGGSRLTIPGSLGYDPLATLRVGDVAVVTMKGIASPLATNHCTGCTVRGASVFSSSSAAVSALDAQGALFERLYSIPKPGTDRLVSTFGSGFNFVGPNNQVRLSRSIRTMDDGFGFGGRFVGTVVTQPGSRTLVVEGTLGVPTVLGERELVPIATPVAFQRYSDGVVLGNAVVVSQSPPTSAPPYQSTFIFDRDLPANLAGSVMYSTDASQNGGNTVIERNTVQSQSCCKGFYIQGLANSSIRGNYIRHSSWSGFFILQALAVAGDPPTAPPMNLSVARNVIDGTNIKSDWWWFEFGAIQTVTLTSLYDLMAGSPLSNINLTDNFIADSGRSGVWLGNTAGGSVSGNYVLDANGRPDLANAYPPRLGDALRPIVVDTTSSGVVTANNVVDNTSGRLFVTDTQYRELAAYAPGGTIRLNAYGVGALPSPALTLTDADGQTMGLTIQSTTAHALDLQLPPGAALGGAYVTLTSGGRKYFGTLFVDSQDDIPAVNGCTFEASFSSTSVPSSATSVPILVVTQAGCPYPVVANDPFVTVGGAGTGTGVVIVTLSDNSGPTRSATIEIAGQPFTLRQAPPGLGLHVASPCRVLDTRNGSPAPTPLLAGSVRTFAVSGLCTIPSSARAVAANVTIVQPSQAGDLRIFPAGSPAPFASTVNFQPGQVRANSAILGLGSEGQVSVQTDMGGGSVHLVLDVVGWFE